VAASVAGEHKTLIMQDSSAKISSAGVPVRDTGLLPDVQTRGRLRRWRNFKDGFSRYGIAIGGGGVVVALTLMFVYLLSEVMPLFLGAEIEQRSEMQIAELTGLDPEAVGYIALERYDEGGLVYARDGRILQLDLNNSSASLHTQLQIPEGVSITSFSAGDPNSNLVVYGLSDGTALVLAHNFDLSFEGGVRRITSEIRYPLGEAPLIVDNDRQPLGQACRSERRRRLCHHRRDRRPETAHAHLRSEVQLPDR
jgi:phosphate transport system permease protein